MGVAKRGEDPTVLGTRDGASGTRLERAMLGLTRELGRLTFSIQERTLWSHERAAYYNRLAIASRTAEAYHRREWERQYQERIDGTGQSID